MLESQPLDVGRNWRKAARRIGATVLTMLLVAALVRSARDVVSLVGTDLVPKIGGAQRFYALVSPYREWTSQQIGFLSDANGVLPMSRCSYPPTLLLFYGIGCHLDYRLVRYCWAAAEWTALLISVAVCVAISVTEVERWAIAILGIALIACSYFFRLHVERGQYYIFVTLLWALAWASCKRRGLNSWQAGFFLGLAAAIRPTSLPALLPLAVFGFRRALVSSLATFGAVIAASLAVGGVRAWTDFADLVRYIGKCTVIVPAFQRPPPVGETLAGYDAVAHLMGHTTNTSILAQLVTVANVLHLRVDEGFMLLLAQGIVAAALAIALGWMIRVRNSQTERRVVLWLFFIALICDFASPVRHGYADVLYFVPIAVALPYLLAAFPRAGVAGWAGALVFSGFCWSLVTEMGFVSTLARTACVMTGLAIVLAADEPAPVSGDGLEQNCS